MADLRTVGDQRANDRKGQHANAVERGSGVEPELHRIAALQPLDLFAPVQMPASTGVERSAIRISVGSGGGDLGPAAKAGIKQVLVAQLVTSLGVDVKALGLLQHRFGPMETEPCEVLQDRGDKFGFTAFWIGVLDPQ